MELRVYSCVRDNSTNVSIGMKMSEFKQLHAKINDICLHCSHECLCTTCPLNNIKEVKI